MRKKSVRVVQMLLAFCIAMVFFSGTLVAFAQEDTTEKKDISTLKAEELGQYFENGSAIKPNVVVYDGDYLLVLGKDYIISYTNNIKAGTATAKMEGKGNYSGQLETTYKILEREGTSAQSLKIVLLAGGAIFVVGILIFAIEIARMRNR